MKSKKKGFTLIELIVVLAIIAILSAVLIPSWGYFMNRARTRSQNNKAKAIFNAAQTVVTELNFAERKYVMYHNAAGATNETKTAALNHIYSTTTLGEEWYYFFDGTTGYRINADGTKYDLPTGSTDKRKQLQAEWDKKIADDIKRIVNDNDTYYKFYVRDYKVMAVASSRYASDRYLGTYPITIDTIDDYGKVKVSTLRNAKVKGVDLHYFDCEDQSDIK